MTRPLTILHITGLHGGTGFSLSSTPVTQGQWQEVTGKRPDNFLGTDLPVELVVPWRTVAGLTSPSLNDVYDFLNMLSIRERLSPAYVLERGEFTWNRVAEGYRLPTETEWDLALQEGLSTWELADRIGNIRDLCWDPHPGTYTLHDKVWLIVARGAHASTPTLPIEKTL